MDGLARIYALGFISRIPPAAAAVLLTLHVVNGLGHSWSAAGGLAGAATVCAAIAGPWRGRLLDRVGLRATMAPCLVVNAIAWSIAPFVGYWALLALACVAGLWQVPVWSIIRQAVLAAAPEEDRRSAIALDSVTVEMAFAIGPSLTVWAATVYDTRWVLLVVQLAGVLAASLLWLANPTLLPDEARDEQRLPLRQWAGPAFLAMLLVAATSSLVLAATDVSVVAATKEMGNQSALAWILVVWSVGSLIGGLIYGALPRAVPAVLLLGILCLTTFPLAFAKTPVLLGVLCALSGLVISPTIVATVDGISKVVPVTARGEAMGWHGSALTIGGAVGAPIAGVAIDTWGSAGGFIAPAAVGAGVAVIAGLLMTMRKRRGSAARLAH